MCGRGLSAPPPPPLSGGGVPPELCVATKPMHGRAVGGGGIPGEGGRAGMQKGRHFRGDPRDGWIGGWRRLPNRLGAVTVGYKCH